MGHSRPATAVSYWPPQTAKAHETRHHLLSHLSTKPLLLDLLPNQPPNPENYTFDSIEVKETSFRIDGVLIPPNSNGIIVFSEVQMQPIANLYERMFSEIGTYTYRHTEQFHDWQAIAVYPDRETEQPTTKVPHELFDSGRILPIYLNELGQISQLPLGIALLVLTILEGEEAKIEAQRLINRAKRIEAGNAIMEMVSTIMVYKFTELSRDQVNQMLNYTIDELKQTRFYQEVSQEGREEGQRNLLFTMLNAKFGKLSPQQQTSIQSLSADRLQSLSIALLNFTDLTDFQNWLNTHQ